MPKVKYTYEFLVDYFLENGYKLLTPKNEYKNVGTKLTLRCPNGHGYTTCWSNFFGKGHRCRKCLSKGVEQVSKAFLKDGYTLLSTQYKNQYTPLEYRCNRGHIHSTTWNNWQNGSRCPECVKTSYKDIVEYFNSWGYKVLSEEKDYTHNRFKFKFICPAGHFSSMCWVNFKNGHRCGECALNRKKTYDEIKNLFEVEGYKLLSKKYSSSDKVKFLCPAGHKYQIMISNFNAGQRCGLCAGNQPKTIEEVREYLESIGWQLISTDYVNSYNKLITKCPNDHLVEKSWNTFRMGRGCASCSSKVSKAELEIQEFLKENGVEFIANDRNILSPYELDILIPSKNLAIEYCGLYWHSENGGGKHRMYHRDKYEACLLNGIRLITIFEDEFLERPEVVLSRILHAVGITDNRIYARKCDIRRITNLQGNEFYSRYHLQGKTNGKYSWGLFYGGELVAALTVGSLSRNSAAGKNKKMLELKRMASVPFTSVVGGFSRLFLAAKKFLVNERISSLKTYCDMRYGNPSKTIYDTLGFNFVSETKYSPHYVRGENRFRNHSLAKTAEERLTGKTEWELRQEQGYDRIFDCGTRTYLYKL